MQPKSKHGALLRAAQRAFVMILRDPAFVKNLPSDLLEDLSHDVDLLRERITARRSRCPTT